MRFDPEYEAGSVVNNSVSEAKGNFLRNRTVRNTILYIVGTILIFGLVAYLGHLLSLHLPGSTTGFWAYLITVGIVLLLGLWHTSLMHSAIPAISTENYLLGTIITLLIGIIGGTAMFVLSFGPKMFSIQEVLALNKNVRPLISTVLIFPLPFFLQWAYAAYDNIPPKIYDLWQYNPGLLWPELRPGQRKTSVVFVVDIRYGSRFIYEIISGIPDKMNVGDGFQISIDEHNEDNPERKISWRDPRNKNQEKNLYHWHFYVQNPWYRPDRYINPYRDCRENSLLNGTRITARRIPPGKYTL